jgi:hypothetical protein
VAHAQIPWWWTCSHVMSCSLTTVAAFTCAFQLGLATFHDLPAVELLVLLSFYLCIRPQYRIIYLDDGRCDPGFYDRWSASCCARQRLRSSLSRARRRVRNRERRRRQRFFGAMGGGVATFTTETRADPSGDGQVHTVHIRRMSMVCPRLLSFSLFLSFSLSLDYSRLKIWMGFEMSEELAITVQLYNFMLLPSVTLCVGSQDLIPD